MADISEGGFELSLRTFHPGDSLHGAAPVAPPERSGANRRRPNELRVRFLLKSKKSRRSAELYWPNDGNFSESTAWGDDVVLVLATLLPLHLPIFFHLAWHCYIF